MECCTRASSLQHTNTHTHTHSGITANTRTYGIIQQPRTSNVDVRQRPRFGFTALRFASNWGPFWLTSSIILCLDGQTTKFPPTVCLDKQRTFACMACNGATRALTQTQTHGSYSTWARVSRLPWFMASRCSKRVSLGINGTVCPH